MTNQSEPLNDRPTAAIALVERWDGKVLCVWNKHYGRWTLPGGKVEAGEHPADAVKREVREETGTEALVGSLVYEGAPNAKAPAGRGQHIRVFACTIRGEPRETETGCPVTWFTRGEFLQYGVVPEFYARVFAAWAAPVAAQPHDYQCDGCGVVAVGSYVEGGWWSYPPGWFLRETDEQSAIACSRACVERLEADDDEPEP